MHVTTGSVPRGTLPVLVSVLAALVVPTLVVGEVVQWQAARRGSSIHPAADVSHESHDPAAPGSAVVVLGFANRGTAPNLINRWRARIGLRTAYRLQSAGAEVRIICCGAAVRGTVAEADLLAVSLRNLGWRGAIITDTTSSSTWENIEYARPHLGDVDQIAVCSNGLHAEKARVYLRRQDPQLAALLVPADDYRFGEMIFVKPVLAAVGLWKLRRLRDVSRGTRTSGH